MSRRQFAGRLPVRAARRARRELTFLRHTPALKAANPESLLPGDWERVYHYHVRKSGGTSLNQAFLALAGRPAEETYARISRDLVFVDGDYVFVAHSKRLINGGNYLFGFSHLPSHAVSLAPRTFTIAILRDPVARIASHYYMLERWLQTGTDHPALVREGPWAANGLSGFLSSAPVEAINAQTFMFSARGDPAEAVARLHEVDRVLFTDDLTQEFSTLGDDLGLPLVARRANARQSTTQHPDAVLEHMSEVAAPDIEFYRQARAALGS